MVARLKSDAVVAISLLPDFAFLVSKLFVFAILPIPGSIRENSNAGHADATAQREPAQERVFYRGIRHNRIGSIGHKSHTRRYLQTNHLSHIWGSF